MSAAERLLSRLEGVKATGADRWTALCPAHDDRRPSLSLRHAEERVLLHCWSGCAAGDIVAALGLSLADLFDDNERHAYHTPRRPPLPTVREFLALIEYYLAVTECVYANVLCGVPFTEGDRRTASDALIGLRRILDVCYER